MPMESTLLQGRWTRHGLARCAQRAIPRRAAELVLLHGRDRAAGGGRRRIRLDREDRAALEAELGPQALRLAAKLRAEVVVEDGTVITVLWPRRGRSR